MSVLEQIAAFVNYYCFHNKTVDWASIYANFQEIFSSKQQLQKYYKEYGFEELKHVIIPLSVVSLVTSNNQLLANIKFMVYKQAYTIPIENVPLLLFKQYCGEHQKEVDLLLSSSDLPKARDLWLVVQNMEKSRNLSANATVGGFIAFLNNLKQRSDSEINDKPISILTSEASSNYWSSESKEQQQPRPRPFVDNQPSVQLSEQRQQVQVPQNEQVNGADSLTKKQPPSEQQTPNVLSNDKQEEQAILNKYGLNAQHKSANAIFSRPPEVQQRTKELVTHQVSGDKIVQHDSAKSAQKIDIRAKNVEPQQKQSLDTGAAKKGQYAPENAGSDQPHGIQAVSQGNDNHNIIKPVIPQFRPGQLPNSAKDSKSGGDGPPNAIGQQLDENLQQSARLYDSMASAMRTGKAQQCVMCTAAPHSDCHVASLFTRELQPGIVQNCVSFMTTGGSLSYLQLSFLPLYIQLQKAYINYVLQKLQDYTTHLLQICGGNILIDSVAYTAGKLVANRRALTYFNYETFRAITNEIK